MRTETKSLDYRIQDLTTLYRDEKNVIEAASNGASNGIMLVANIIANLIVFLAFLEFFNTTVIWLGEMVGIQGLTFEVREHTNLCISEK